MEQKHKTNFGLHIVAYEGLPAGLNPIYFETQKMSKKPKRAHTDVHTQTYRHGRTDTDVQTQTHRHRRTDTDVQT